MRNTDREAIARHAYFLWEKDGRPHGRSLEHWLRAERELSGDGKPPLSQRKSPKGVKAAASPRRAAARKAPPPARGDA